MGGKIMFISLKINRKLLEVMLIIVILCTAMTSFLAFADSENDDKKEGIFVPIIMYHGILKDEDMCGKYVVSPINLEKDMAYLKENGYTTIFVNDLIRYVNYGEELPEKPVILSFDDGTYNNYTYLFPLLEKYNFKATISIVGSYTFNASESGEKPNPAYSYLRWEDITEMRNSGLVEFCNHSYDLHTYGNRKGASRMSGESYEDYRELFLSDIIKTQQLCDENCEFSPNVYTYPFGSAGESAERLVKNYGFSASLGVEEKPNYIEKDNPDCLYNLNRYNRDNNLTTEEFMKKALSA